MTPEAQLHQRVRELETAAARNRLAGYARLYSGVLPVMIALTFVPYYEAENSTYATLWQMADNEVGQAGIALLAVLAIFLMAGAFRPDLWGVPFGVAIPSAGLAGLLISKVGTGSSSPDHSAGGLVAMVLGLLLVAVAVAQVFHLRVVRADIRHREAIVAQQG